MCRYDLRVADLHGLLGARGAGRRGWQCGLPTCCLAAVFIGSAHRQRVDWPSSDQGERNLDLLDGV